MNLLGILGTGLIGASIGMRARRDGARVLGFDVDPASAQEALKRGAVDELVTREALYERCDTIAIAVPPSATCAELERLDGIRPAWHLLIDVASVKAPVVKSGAGVRNFVATHPLAGNEGRGPGAARADLFQDRTWAYVPSAEEMLDEAARSFIERMGATPFACDAARHDRVVAITSHVPQLLAFIVAEQMRETGAEYGPLCGSAGREILRLAQSPHELWSDILAANGDAVGRAGRAVARALTEACDRLNDG